MTRTEHHRKLERMFAGGPCNQGLDVDISIEEGAAEHAADEGAVNGELVPTSAFDNDLTQRYPGKDVEVHDVPGAFVFHVETDGSFTVEELVRRAVECISDRAAELEEKVAI